ncbi:TIGR03854 family LLM class F420-dependent oxidoreductase [Pseudonocardia ailaonensis]|uniref:TIGR03854 family LLM class F420-dependent oxidoreductase n=1 Tax=Pseudonocardia ailaonensis TaxID=367279 RepID=A0ABN2NR76_9PSEU
MKVRIGVGSLPTGAQGVTELVDELEARGIDSLWLPDIVGTDGLDPLTGMAYAAGRTRSLKIGTGVLVLPGRNPALVAAQLASLAALAPTRILPVFGVRSGRARDRQFYPVPGERGAVFDEALLVIRRLLTEERVSHEGAFYQLHDASVGPRPPGPLDLWLAGHAPVALERIGRLGDGWLGSGVSPEEAGRCRLEIERAAAEAGREIEADHYGTNIGVVQDGTSEAEIAAILAATAQRRPEIPPERVVARSWAEARSRITEFVEAGLTKFVIRPATPITSWHGFLDRFEQELRPLET